MRIEDAHEGRALCAKQAEVSPVSNKSHKHALRAMWIDDCELWVKMHSRPDRWPQIVRFASGRADSLANRRFVNDLNADAGKHRPRPHFLRRQKCMNY